MKKHKDNMQQLEGQESQKRNIFYFKTRTNQPSRSVGIVRSQTQVTELIS
jgi:hypothetical protein